MTFPYIHHSYLVSKRYRKIEKKSIICKRFRLSYLKGIKHKERMILIINNRAGGNAPMIARLIAEKFLTI
jgi:hypothetical protein